MSMHYQPLNYYPQPPTASDTCCGPSCAGFCCAKPACCLEPNFCSHVGACPCFCTGSSTAFSLALSAIWVALPLLVVAMSLPDLFVFDYTLDYANAAQLGMWQLCTYDRDAWWVLSCAEYGREVSMDDAYLGLGVTFNAMRILTLVGSVATLAAGILAAVRLAFQQRAKPISPILSWSLVACAVLALSTVAAGWGLSMRLYNNFSSFYNQHSDGLDPPMLGSEWIVLTTAFGVLVGGRAAAPHRALLLPAQGEDAADHGQHSLLRRQPFNLSRLHCVPVPSAVFTVTACRVPASGDVSLSQPSTTGV